MRDISRGRYLATRFRRPWQRPPRTVTDHPRLSYRTRVLATRSQRAFFVDGLLAAASDVAVVRFLAIYALALGATNQEIGLLAVANGVAGLLALAPGAWLAERTRSRKWLVLYSWGGVGRVTVLLMVIAPLVATHQESIYLLIALSSVRWFMSQFSHPAWTAVLTGVIPSELRRFYISQRMLAMSLVTMAGAPLAGVMIRNIGGIEGYQWTFLVAAVCGFLASWSYALIEEPQRQTSTQSRGSTRAMLQDRAFVWYALTTGLLHTSTMIAGPFFAPYLVHDLGATPEQIGLLGTIEAGAMVAAQLAVGLLVVRLGPLPILRAVMFAVSAVPLLWLFASNPWEVAPAHLLGGAAWAAYNVVSFTLLVEMAPEANLPRYSAAHQAMVISASIVGPLIGIFVVASGGIGTAIVISTIGRVIAGLMLSRVSRLAREALAIAATNEETESLEGPAAGG